MLQLFAAFYIVLVAIIVVVETAGFVAIALVSDMVLLLMQLILCLFLLLFAVAVNIAFVVVTIVVTANFTIIVAILF